MVVAIEIAVTARYCNSRTKREKNGMKRKKNKEKEEKRSYVWRGGEEKEKSGVEEGGEDKEERRESDRLGDRRKFLNASYIFLNELQKLEKK